MKAMRGIRGTSAAAGFLFLFLSLPALAVEHPGSIHQDDDCSSCHAAKTTGKSVHSAMTISCTVCHVAQTQGDMTRLSLLMPKERICSACHDTSAELRKHSTKVKGLCLDCHDAHSSDQRLLLREQADLGPGGSTLRKIKR